MVWKSSSDHRVASRNHGYRRTCDDDNEPCVLCADTPVLPVRQFVLAAERMDLVKVMSWYDNEWGYANQMLREALSVTQTVAR